MMALFTYGFSIAEKAFDKAGIKLQTLCDYQNLISTALEKGEISRLQSENLKNWRKNPEIWSPKVH